MATTRSLEQAFNAIFHSQDEFHEFRMLEISNEIVEISLKDRKILKTSEKLKKYLRFIDRVIFRNLSREESVVHSFIKGKSALTAIQEHKLNSHFFITDIKSFFSNISESDVRKILERDKYVLPINDIEIYIEKIVSMTTIGGYIPIGFPTSPQLSNAFLFDFDREFKSYCDGMNLVYSRYADDIIVSSDGFDKLENLQGTVQALLNEHASDKMVLNSEKTYITHKGNKVKILGLVIMPNGSVTIDSKYKKNIESLIHFYLKDKKKYSDFLGRMMGGDEKSLFGFLHYAKSIDPEYIKKLQKKYGIYVLSKLMEDRWSDRG